MVHRILNRNPGYSDFSNIGSSASFNFSNTTASTPISHGANALKLENEIIQDQQAENSQNQMMSEDIMENNSTESERIVEDNSVNEIEKSFTQEAIEEAQDEIQENNKEEASNDLKEFGVDSDSPDLFSSENENSSPEDLLSSNEEEDDDLEIPAFLRRQKN